MGIFSPTTTNTTGTTTTQLPPWLESAYRDLYNRGAGLSAQPYPLYPGPRVAGLTAPQYQGIAASGVMGVGTPAVSQAQGMAQQAAVPPSTQGLLPYINPYHELVTSDVLRELDRRHGIQTRDAKLSSAMAKSFGGARSGIMETELARNQERLISDVLSQRYSDAYSQGLGQFNLQQGVMSGAANQLGQLGVAQRALSQSDIQQLMGSGAMLQGINQQGLNLAYEDFTRQQQYPYQQTEYLANILGTLRYPQTSITQQQQLGPSTGQQIGGLALGGVGVYGLLDKLFSD